MGPSSTTPATLRLGRCGARALCAVLGRPKRLFPLLQRDVVIEWTWATFVNNSYGENTASPDIPARARAAKESFQGQIARPSGPLRDVIQESLVDDFCNIFHVEVATNRQHVYDL